jgi:membrane fusion protein (multidrug efflux system)
VPVREAQYQSSLAGAERAKAQLEEARLQLGYTLIRAPISGQVTAKHVQLGDYVSPGQRLLTIVPLQDIYVTANFKETQLARVRIGQRAVIHADMYGGMKFKGVVDSIAGSTGSEQALLPPQNATGNFVKVVQRIPVKIRVLNKSASDTVLRPGMNVEVTIYVH